MPEALMNEQDIYDLIAQYFDFEPTSGQDILMRQLAGFIYRFREPSLFVLKGYAGTGKTTIVSALVKAMPKLNISTVLLAPTGRAAKVMANYTGKAAHTIHKKIYKTYSDGNGNIRLTLQKNTHKNTLFIVDEASMIPDYNQSGELNTLSERSLLNDLFTYVSEGFQCKLILIGDAAQLPPVGSDESPALDVSFLQALFHHPVETFELTEVVRQAKDSGILRNATAIRTKIAHEDAHLPLFNIARFNDLVKLPGIDLEETLHKAYTQHVKDEVAVICRSNKRANMFNEAIRQRILFLENEIAAGDFMMILKNNYYWITLGSDIDFIANGDIVEILRIKKIEEMYGFRFADVQIRLVDYPDEKPMEVKILLDTITLESPALPYSDSRRLFDEVMKDYEEIPSKRKRFLEAKKNPYLNALQVKFAYAFTCHKTQGGQWHTVFVDQGYFTNEMLDLSFLRWMYTAITRATQQVYLVNFKEEFYY